MENGIIHFAVILICIGTMITSIMSVLTFLRVEKVSHAVDKVEHATNSMKDDLVAATAKMSHAEGRKEAEDEGIEKQREADSL
jgi:CHASE3 domain sensor protein